MSERSEYDAKAVAWVLDHAQEPYVLTIQGLLCVFCRMLSSIGYDGTVGAHHATGCLATEPHPDTVRIGANGKSEIVCETPGRFTYEAWHRGGIAKGCPSPGDWFEVNGERVVYEPKEPHP